MIFTYLILRELYLRKWIKKMELITRKVTIHIAALYLLLTAIQYVNAENVRVYGIVSENDTGKPIQTAEVMFISNADDTTRTTTNIDGSYEVFLEVYQTSVDKTPRFDNFKLYQNYPNPFNPCTVIKYELETQAYVKLDIYNITGQFICNLRYGFESAGNHNVLWRGQDETGRPVSSGIYFYRLQTDRSAQTKKMTLLDSVNNARSQQYKLTALNSCKTDNDTEIYYDIIVEKMGYETYTEEKFTILRGTKEIEKNFIISENSSTTPVSHAGSDQETKVGNYIKLDGSASLPGTGEIKKYKWSADPDNPSRIRFYKLDQAKQKVFTGFDTPGMYKIFLVVDNGIEESEPDEVLIKVNQRDKIIFEDPNLELSVRYTLKMPAEELTGAILASIDTLRHYFIDIISLNGIENCGNLKYLDMSLQAITDITPLSHLIQLERLDLDQNRTISDISPLAGLTQLIHLNLACNQITDISMLSDLTRLTYLNLKYNPINDISVVSNMVNLEELWMAHYPIRDISPIKELGKLTLLWMTGCEINDLTPLSELRELRRINLDNNQITDISPLAGLTEIEALYLGKNQVDDISILEDDEKIVRLRLNRNQITDITPLVNNKNFGKGDLIDLMSNPLDSISVNVHIPALKERGVSVIW